MGKCRVFVVESLEGHVYEVFDNRKAANAYADTRGPDYLGVGEYEVKSEFVMPVVVWRVTVDDYGSEIKREDFWDWGDEYLRPCAHCFRRRGPGSGLWNAWGVSREGPEDALRVAREKMKEHSQSRTT